MPGLFYEDQFAKQWLAEMHLQGGGNAHKATLVTFSKSGSTDSYGDDEYESSEQTVTVVQGYQTTTKLPARNTHEIGEARRFDFEWFSADDVFKNMTIPAVGEHSPRLIVDGREHRIVEGPEPSGTGLYRVITTQERK